MQPFPHTLTSQQLLSTYLVAKDVIIQLGYDHELRWQSNLRPEAATESDFLREFAWVTLCCGMNERVVRAKFPFVSHAFYDWRSASRIVKRQETCQRLALIHFRHPGRIGSIIHVAAVLCSTGFARFKRVSLVANARASRAELM